MHRPCRAFECEGERFAFKPTRQEERDEQIARSLRGARQQWRFAKPVAARRGALGERIANKPGCLILHAIQY